MNDGSAKVEDRLHLFAAHYPLSKDEQLSFTSLLERENSMQLFVLANHHVDEGGELRGFKCSVHSNTDSSKLPLNREIFWGCTMVEINPYNQSFHPSVLRIIEQKDTIKSTMLSILQEIAKTPNLTANLHTCSPAPVLVEDTIFNVNYRDTEQWEPDIPLQFGIYHAYVKNIITGIREHKLYVLSFGGTRKASEQFYTMSLDLAGNCTASELCESHEAWWLQVANRRCRLKFIQKICEVLDLPTDLVPDKHAFLEQDNIPCAVTDTCYHSMRLTDDRRSVLLHSESIDTPSVANGMIVKQLPLEGVWLFHGENAQGVSKTCFGSSFGDEYEIGSFPAGTFKVTDTIVGCSSSPSRSAPYLFFFDPVTGQEVAAEHNEKYALLDAEFLKNLEKNNDWKNYPITELMPLIVGIQHET
jgi:hypothetical protein